MKMENMFLKSMTQKSQTMDCTNVWPRMKWGQLKPSVFLHLEVRVVTYCLCSTNVYGVKVIMQN